MKLLQRFSPVLVIVLSALIFAPQNAIGQQCGDITGDGKLDLADFVGILDPLHVAGPPPAHPSKGDIDTYQRLTTYDAIKLFDEIFFPRPPVSLTCPGFNPPLDPPHDPDFRVVYGDTISGGASQAVIPITLVTPVAVDWITLPLRLRLDGAPPTIDSVVYDTSITNPPLIKSNIVHIRHDSAVINTLVFVLFGAPVELSGAHHFMDIYLTVPPSPVLRTVDIAFTKLKPLNAPTLDTGVIPMVVEFSVPNFPDPPPHDPYTPTLIRDFLCGDVNHDYVIDSLDIQTLVDYYFNCGAPPHPIEAGDVNCDSLIDLNDLMLVTSAATGGGPTLCCINDLFPPQGDMPIIPPPTPRQDSLLVELQQALSKLGL
ncbi:MAG: dockerin type I domain-containing protein [Candidatus Zixiibacteriota bacterium]